MDKTSILRMHTSLWRLSIILANLQAQLERRLAGDEALFNLTAVPYVEELVKECLEAIDAPYLDLSQAPEEAAKFGILLKKVHAARLLLSVEGEILNELREEVNDEDEG